MTSSCINRVITINLYMYKCIINIIITCINRVIINIIILYESRYFIFFELYMFCIIYL